MKKVASPDSLLMLHLFFIKLILENHFQPLNYFFQTIRIGLSSTKLAFIKWESLKMSKAKTCVLKSVCYRGKRTSPNY